MMMSKRLVDILILLSTFACLEGSQSFVIQPKQWDYKGHDIAFEISQRVTTTTSSSSSSSRSAKTLELVTAGVSSNTKSNTQLMMNATETTTTTTTTIEKSETDDDSSYTLDNSGKEKEPILLLNGFGVGSFHQHRLIPQLLEKDNRHVYCIDYLGQGKSWPIDCEDGMGQNEKGLIYSAETWIDQVIRFIEEVILPEHNNESNAPKKVHLVGNSVGGHIAAHVANVRPDLVSSICLLNPTPVWGLNLPGWSGHLPAPKIPKAIGRYLFDRIRDLNTIKKYLENAYARKEAFDKQLMHDIRGCTLGSGGHAAFASILFSPPMRVSSDNKGDFQECLARLQCDVLLVFGKDDPWCKPAFGKKMLQALDQRKPGKVHRYVEIENCGHCPNHEAPQAVSRVVSAWVGADGDRSTDTLPLHDADREVFQEAWGETATRERKQEDIQLSFVDRLATTFV